jgi:hypothetical protein
MAPGLNQPKISERSRIVHTRAVMVGKVFPALVSIRKSSGMARGAGGGMNTGSFQGNDERDVGENVPRLGAQVAVKVSACLGADGGAGRKPGVSPFSAGGVAQAAHEFTQNLRGLVMAALYETAEAAAAWVVHNFVVFDSVATGARPARAKGKERAHFDAHLACVLN